MPRVRLMSLFNYLWWLDCCFFGSDQRTGIECGIVSSFGTCNLTSLESGAQCSLCGACVALESFLLYVRPWLSLVPNLTVGLAMCIYGRRGWEALVMRPLHRWGETLQ